MTSKRYIKALRDSVFLGIGIHILEETETFRRARAVNVQMETLSDDELRQPIKPIMILSEESAQILMDDLWRAGLRPTVGTSPSGQINALENHVDSLQSIVSNLFKLATILAEQQSQ